MVRSKTPPGELLIVLLLGRPIWTPPGSVDHGWLSALAWIQEVKSPKKPYVLCSWDEARYCVGCPYFYDEDDRITKDPGYDRLKWTTKPVQKPFVKYRRYARYRFLLDHLQKTIWAFYKRSSLSWVKVRVNVLMKQFWVYFIDPEVVYNKGSLPDYLEDQVSGFRILPAVGSSTYVESGVLDWIFWAAKVYLSLKRPLFWSEVR